MPASCALLVDWGQYDKSSGAAGSTSNGGSTGSQCASSEKWCPDKNDDSHNICVSLTNPAYGCGSELCQSCAFPNATPTCTSGASECTISVCNGDHKDCDRDEENGCEVDARADPNNCGQCGHVCNLGQAIADCANRRCVVVLCNEGYSDCDADPLNGCECQGACTADSCAG